MCALCFSRVTLYTPDPVHSSALVCAGCGSRHRRRGVTKVRGVTEVIASFTQLLHCPRVLTSLQCLRQLSECVSRGMPVENAHAMHTRYSPTARVCHSVPPATQARECALDPRAPRRGLPASPEGAAAPTGACRASTPLIHLSWAPFGLDSGRLLRRTPTFCDSRQSMSQNVPGVGLWRIGKGPKALT